MRRGRYPLDPSGAVSNMGPNSEGPNLLLLPANEIAAMSCFPSVQGILDMFKLVHYEVRTVSVRFD